MGNRRSSGDLAKRVLRAHESRRGTPRRRTGDDLRIQILQAIENYWHEHGRPPTIREIGTAVGIDSSGHVAYHAAELVDQGLLTREPGMSRGLMPTRPVGLRILGTIAAGAPLDQFDDGESELLELGELAMAIASAASGTGREVYALRVRGTSMIDDGILDGDYVLIARGSTVANGTIAVAIQNTSNGGHGAATLKRIFVQPDGVWLQPANPAFNALFLTAREWDKEWSVQGTVLAIYRQYAPHQVATALLSS